MSEYIVYEDLTAIEISAISSVIVHNGNPLRHTVIFKNGVVQELVGCSGLATQFNEMIKKNAKSKEHTSFKKRIKK